MHLDKLKNLTKFQGHRSKVTLLILKFKILLLLQKRNEFMFQFEIHYFQECSRPTVANFVQIADD